MPSFALVSAPTDASQLTVRQCAALAGRSPSWVRDQIQSGALRAELVDGRYMVPGKSMARLMQRVRPARSANLSSGGHLHLVIDNTVFKK